MENTQQHRSPAALGYRLPAEWEPHAATWLAWPHNRDTWPGCFDAIPPLWVELVRTLAPHEPVHILASRRDALQQARSLLAGIANVTLHEVETDDAWLRDSGPLFLAGPSGAPPALVDWEYNAWGGKYPPYENDNSLGRHIARLTGRRRFAPGIVLEGGAIDSNGRGTVLASQSCLLHPNRNGDLSRAGIERYLADYCGARKVLWLGGEIAGDDTDGHIDQLARFVSPTAVAAAAEQDPSDANYRPLQENLARLRCMTDQDGGPLRVIPLPMPRPLYHQGARLPASYTNFYIANSLVIVPQYDDPADEVALKTLQQLFPNRQVVGLPATDLVRGLGAYHCITQQQPAGKEGR